MKSALQKEAERQVLAMQIELSQYRQSGSFDFAKACQALNQSSKWHTSYETLNGDFALDEVLAQGLASNVVSTNPEAGWLTAYLNYEPSQNAGFGEYAADAAGGPTNVLGTAGAVSNTVEATIAQSKINSATAKIAAGKAQSVKINSHMTLYNAEKSMRKPPILRVRIDKMPIKVISPMFHKGVRTNIWRRGVYAHAKNVKDMSRLAGSTSKMRFLNGKGGGILTFAPTMAFDLYDSVNRDANGNLNWNRRQFINSELKNQPGNAVGWAGGVAAGALAISLGAVGAPVIVCVLIGGIIVQALWNWSGAPNQMPQIASEGGY